MTKEAKTLGEVINSGSKFLESKNITSPQLLCEILAARLMNCKRLELPLRYDTVLSDKQLDAMRRGFKRLLTNEPVQYITGETEFMGHRFRTDKRALIPRPETELLVEEVLNKESIWESDKPLIVEIGTGTGCISISLAHARSSAVYLALDISDDAISLAKENAVLNRMGDNLVFANAELGDTIDPESADAIVANLPYISTDDCEKLPANVRDHEPRMALDGGPDGISIIEPVIQDASFALKAGAMIFLEIGETQASTVSALLKETGFNDVTVVQDLNSRDRIVTAVLS